MLFTTSILLDVVLILVVGVYLIYLYTSRKQTYWAKRGVTTPKIQPIFGHFFQVATFKTALADWLKEYYDVIDKPFFGIYVFDDPYVVIKDAQLVKNVLIKDFNHFVDRNVAAPDHDPLVRNMMFIQKSPAWRHDRVKLSVAFTSGKLKKMFPLFKKSQDDLANYLKRNRTVLEAKELAAKFTTEVISRCAFGIESHCFGDEPSVFRNFGRKCFDFSFRNALSSSLAFVKPRWVSYFKLHFMPQDAMEYFQNAFWQTIQMRKDDERIDDLIDILNDLRKNNEIRRDDKLLMCGIAIQFYLAGYETTSASISFTLYELAKNPHIQDKLRESIRATIKEHGALTYDVVNNLQYLDMCMYETLRKYPPLAFLERKCNADYQIHGSDVVIEKGVTVLIPALGLHRDEQYFEDPDTYDPERFRNRLDNSKGVYYLAFGEGPRGCIGERFGKMSTKMALITILLNSEVTFCKETPDPVKFEPKCWLIQAAGGLHLMFNPLTK